MMVDEKNSFTRVRKIYSSAHYGKSLLWYTSEFIFSFYLAEVYQIPPQTIGKLLFIFLLWDAITDPLLVLFITRKQVTVPRLIKFQFCGAILSAASFISIFFKPNINLSNLSIYALAVGILFRTAYTYYDVPQNTLAKRLGDNEQQRLSLFAYRNIFSAIASLTVSIFTGLVLSLNNSVMLEMGFLMMAIIFVLISTAFSYHLITVARIETKYDICKQNQINEAGVTILKKLIVSPKLTMLLSSMLILSIGWPLTLKLIPFFNSYVYSQPEFTGIMLAVMAIVNIGSQPIWIKLGSAISSNLACLITSLLACLFGLCFLFFSAESLYLAIMIISLFSASISGINVYLWLFLSELIARYNMFERYDTVIFGLFTFSSKIGLSIGGLMLGLTLELIDYKQGQNLTENNIDDLILTMSLVPVVSIIVGAALAIGSNKPLVLKN